MSEAFNTFNLVFAKLGVSVSISGGDIRMDAAEFKFPYLEALWNNFCVGDLEKYRIGARRNFVFEFSDEYGAIISFYEVIYAPAGSTIHMDVKMDFSFNLPYRDPANERRVFLIESSKLPFYLENILARYCDAPGMVRVIYYSEMIVA
jgi:hypothetical protein